MQLKAKLNKNTLNTEKYTSKYECSMYSVLYSRRNKLILFIIQKIVPGSFHRN